MNVRKKQYKIPFRAQVPAQATIQKQVFPNGMPRQSAAAPTAEGSRSVRAVQRDIPPLTVLLIHS
ncbi:MAG: hypothetical protein ACK6D0_05680, partial [Planctomyces sp.]